MSVIQTRHPRRTPETLPDLPASRPASRAITDVALRESEERFRAVFEQAAVGMGVCDLDGRWIRVNQRLADMLGYMPDEMLTMRFQEMTHPDDLPMNVMLREQMVTRQRDAYSIEKRYLHRNGTVVWTNASVSIARSEAREPTHCIAIIQDITARKALEAELLHAQRLEGVGQLAGGIAHDFNNLLTVISGRSQLMAERLDAADPLRKEIDLIHKTADRAAVLTRQLLAFSRKQVLQPKVVVLNELVGASTSMLKRLIGEDIDLAFVPSGEPGRVRVDPGQLEQVIVNLVVNARDAMPDGGRLTIETANVEIDADNAAGHIDLQPGHYVRLAVTDSGVGMTREIQARIFEPFFTTKGPAKGTGLGLATVYGIVKQSGGHIRVYSEVDCGTTFKLYLPRTDAPADALAPRGTSAAPRGCETLLLVEDEADVRALSREILERLGYTVLEAASPADALLIGERHAGPIELLLTDVVMPGMSGAALAERLTGQRPEMRVVFMSGYTDDAIVRHGVLAPGTQLVEKPFSPRELALKLREALAA